jgi:hypothetical protein
VNTQPNSERNIKQIVYTEQVEETENNVLNSVISSEDSSYENMLLQTPNLARNVLSVQNNNIKKLFQTNTSNEVKKN